MIAGVVDTGEQFISGDNDTSNNFVAGDNDTGDNFVAGDNDTGEIYCRSQEQGRHWGGELPRKGESWRG